MWVGLGRRLGSGVVAVVLVVGLTALSAGCASSDSGEGQQTRTSIDGETSGRATGPPPTSTAVRLVAQPEDEIVWVPATTWDNRLEIDLSTHPGDRSLYYRMGASSDGSADVPISGLLVLTSGGGAYLDIGDDRAESVPDGVTDGPGPDVFATDGIAPGRYVACVNISDQNVSACTTFSIEHS